MAAFSNLILFLIVGFVVSYGFSWLFRWVQDPKVIDRFALSEGVRQAATLGVLFVAGPFVLAQQTVDAQSKDEWPDIYLAGAYALSAAWGVALGFAVTQIVTG